MRVNIGWDCLRGCAVEDSEPRLRVADSVRSWTRRTSEVGRVDRVKDTGQG